MALDLLKIAGDVEIIAGKAAKEVDQEDSLSTMQATWDRIEFSATMHKETGTPLVKMADEDVEVRR